MARWLLAGVLVVTMFAGCIENAAPADTDEPSPAVEPDNPTPVANDTAKPPLVGRFLANATLDNGTAAVNTTFNVTLAYEGDNATDAATLVWSVAFTPEDGTNATSLNGTGLPATIALNLTQTGNTTMTGNLTDGTSVVDLEPITILVVGGGLCHGVPPQETFAFSGLWAAAAVSGTGLFVAVPFTVNECQTKIYVELTTSEAYLDSMLRLKDPSGATVDTEDNELLYYETLTYEPGGFLPTGEWDLDLRGFLAGPGNYEGTITFSQ